jgi:hypothetical protein
MIFASRLAVIVLATSLCGGCSSSDSSAPTGKGDAGGTAANACKNSDCPNQKMFFTDSNCAAVLGGSCGDLMRAYLACSLDNDKCTAEGEQDVSVFMMCSGALNATLRCLSDAVDGGPG